MISMSNEMALLCGSVRYSLGGDKLEVDEVKPLNSWVSKSRLEDIDAAKLRRLSLWHGLVGSLIPYLKYRVGSSTPLIKNLMPIYYRQAMHQAIYFKQLLELSEALNHRNVEFVVIKGFAARAQFYSSASSVYRSGSDIDIVVNPRDFPKFVEVLRETNYSCLDCANSSDVAGFAAEFPDKLCKRGLVFQPADNMYAKVDAHWRPANTFSLPLSTDDLLERRQTVQLEGKTILVPHFDHHFIICAIHGYLDHFFQLKHLADLYGAINQPSYNEARVLSLADHLGVRKQVLRSIGFTKVLFSMPCKLSSDSASYVNKMLKRHSDHKGLTPRAHSADGHWTPWNKVSYIGHQIRTRSRNAGFLDPLRNRCLVKFHQVPNV